ncbi:hypothetical protein LR48_Vigan01g105200 [Vigna angularis]|uniref:Uncharacterized protein n=1 Tax=Phaseolus angularis TaxID=3914 RepID=A0A0L9TM37_PHAAN|nr:hypothetical protein LR48_Vigan01g105200 [Vigna angularis]
MTDNVVLEEASKEQHMDPMEMIRKMNKDIEEMKRRHEEERKDLQALREKSTLIKQQMNNKGPTLSTPTQPGLPKRTHAEHERTIQGESKEASRDHNSSIHHNHNRLNYSAPFHARNCGCLAT